MTSWVGMMELSAIFMFELVFVSISYEHEAGLDEAAFTPLMPDEYRMNTSCCGFKLSYNK